MLLRPYFVVFSAARVWFGRSVMELKPCDLDRFDKWAVSRGFTDPAKYMAACEAFEAQQLIIDDLKAQLPILPKNVTRIFAVGV